MNKMEIIVNDHLSVSTINISFLIRNILSLLLCFTVCNKIAMIAVETLLHLYLMLS